MPNIVPILDQHDWHAWRSSGIGASEAGAVCGQNPYATPLDVWLAKTGQSEPQAVSERMDWGHLLEAPIAQRYADVTGETYDGEQTCYESEEHPIIRATVDRTTASGKVVEIKTVGIHSYRNFGPSGDTDSLPRYWLLQAQQQLYCSGRDRVDFAVLLLPEAEMRIYPVMRDDDVITSLIEIELEFWDLVQRRVPPPPENPTDSILASKLRPVGGRIPLLEGHAALADHYAELGEQIKQLEATREGCKAQILDILGDNQYGDLPDGRTIVRSVSEIAERTSVIKAHRRVMMAIRQAKKGK